MPRRKTSPTPETAVEELLNLSDLTGGWLRDEGVATYGELCEADLVQLFHALKATHKQVSRLMYYALVGAVLNIHWNQIPEEERTRELVPFKPVQTLLEILRDLADNLNMGRKSIRRSARGFTLVEIMIVVLIIGILLAMATPQWIKARETTRTRSCLKNLQEIESAKDRWAMEYKRPSGSAVAEADIAGEFLKGNFPLCPSGGTYTIGNVDAFPSCSIHGTVTSIP